MSHDKRPDLPKFGDEDNDEQSQIKPNSGFPADVVPQDFNDTNDYPDA
jgi:hypothetical protein